MGRKHPFCVNNCADENILKQRIQELRRTIRYGRVAEKALRELREKGSCNRPVPVTTRASEWGAGEVSLVTFPEFVDVSRKDVPEYGKLRVSFGKVEKGEHGGHETDEIRIVVQTMGWDPANGWKKRALHVGNARLKRNGETVFVSNMDEPRETVSKLYRTPSTAQAREAYLSIGRAVAHHVVRVFDETKISQPIRDIQSQLPAWLLEDGILQEFCKTVRDNATVASVINA